MPERAKLLMAWKSAKTELEIAKTIEANLRKQVVGTFFDGHKEEGTENVELGQGWKLKGVFKQSYTLAHDDVPGCVEEINKLDESGIIAERLFRTKYELSTAEYKKLPEPFKKLVDLILTIKPASPSLELVEPKK